MSNKGFKISAILKPVINWTDRLKSMIWGEERQELTSGVARQKGVWCHKVRGLQNPRELVLNLNPTGRLLKFSYPQFTHVQMGNNPTQLPSSCGE